MAKTSQNIFIFIASEKLKKMRHETPVKIAMSYMNRFTIDEDASFELMGVHFVPGPNLAGISGQLVLMEKITQISRKMSIRNVRESDNHLMFALNYGIHGRLLSSVPKTSDFTGDCTISLIF